MFAKALNNRLIKLADRLICPNQTTFIKGRFILESVVAAHEIIHDIHRNKESGIILKLDYEKAYDRVSWDFIEEMLISRGFRAKWRSWMKRVIQGGSICVRINNENSVYLVSDIFTISAKITPERAQTRRPLIAYYVQFSCRYFHTNAYESC